MNSLTQKLQAAIDREPMYDTACDGKTHVVDEESYDRLKSICEAMLPLIEAVRDNKQAFDNKFMVYPLEDNILEALSVLESKLKEIEK